MCTYLTRTAVTAGAGRTGDEWVALDRTVVYFDHPVEAPVDHALCLDFRARGSDPAARIAVELDAASARRRAETILAVLDDAETRALTTAASATA